MLSEFLHPFLTNNADETWVTVNNKLQIWFEEMRNPDAVFVQFETIRQGESESIDNVSQRIVNLAQKAYKAFESHFSLVDNQLTRFFFIKA